MMRRAFLGAACGLAAAVVDPDRLPWVPGRRMISVPPVRYVEGDDFRHYERFTPGDLVRYRFEGLSGRLWVVTAVSAHSMFSIGLDQPGLTRQFCADLRDPSRWESALRREAPEHLRWIEAWTPCSFEIAARRLVAGSQPVA